MPETDSELAEALARQWLREPTLLRLAHAMNSSTWEVAAGGERYVLKVSSADAEPGLHVAACLERQGFRTGAPIRTAHREGRLAALLRFVGGRPLSETDVDAVGATLGRAHDLLAGCPVPDRISRWPWGWLDLGSIDDAALRSAATAAVHRAVELAPHLTHGTLHGDPAPEAFRRTVDDIGLIDWGAACHGPLLYDVASAWMYTDERVVAAYARTGPLAQEELAHAADFLAFRWAVQAWYFSTRLATADVTGLPNAEGNEEGLADARRGLLVDP